MHHGNGNQFGIQSKNLYLCVHHCPWNSECNCLQRRLCQPRKDWRQNDYNKESVKLGQTWLAATFEKWYTQISVGLDFRVPCQHTGMVPPPKMCRDEHTKSTNTHTRKHTTSCAKPWRHDNPAFTPLHAHLVFVFFPPSLPMIRTGMSTSVATLGCERGPHLALRHLLRTHAF